MRFKLVNKRYCLLLVLFSAINLVSLPVNAVYKCTNAHGKVAYQDSACQQDAVQKKMHVAVPNSSPSQAEPQARSEQAFVDEGSPVVIRAELSNVLATLSPIKVRVIEYYMIAGKWPKRLADIDLIAAEMTSRHIDKIAIAEKGSIKAYLNSSFGDNKRLLLRPKNVMGGTSVEWQCFANFNKKSLAYSGQQICQSKAIND